MSRIGKKPITLPKGVTVKIDDGAVEVQGPKGKLRQAVPPGILFAKDGEWIGGFGTVKSADIKAFMEKAMGTQNTAKNYHLLSNFVITVKGDTATAWSRWAFVVPGQQGAAIAQAGRYDDELVRENGRWKFKKRVASNDTAGPARTTK